MYCMVYKLNYLFYIDIIYNFIPVSDIYIIFACIVQSIISRNEKDYQSQQRLAHSNDHVYLHRIHRLLFL